MRFVLVAFVALATLPALTASAQEGSAPQDSAMTINRVGLDGKRRVLSHHGFTTIFAFSPDRSRLAYVPYTCDGCFYYDIVLADTRSSREDHLVRTQAGINAVSWAPNGRMIAFSANGVWVVRADGTGLRQLDTEGSFPVWAPDSKRLAVMRLDEQRRWMISVVSVDGGPSTEIAPGQHPVFSPNGRFLAYEDVRGCQCPPRIRIAPVSGGTPRNLAFGYRPLWSPRGDRIAFLSSSLRVVPSRGGRARVLAPGADEFAWSPRGRWIAFTTHLAGTYRQQIKLAAVSGGGRRLLFTEREERGVAALTWARGGRSLFYVALVQP